MVRHSSKTLADYVAIAISPVLIMLLIGSLVYFLLAVFYQGQFEGRLHFVLSMFVMATVLIGRISIERGREYAILFALPLAIVSMIAMFKFVEVRGPLAGLSPYVNGGLLALIWWCADRLTWDCTVIDDEEDASGEGLLQQVGLDTVPAQPAISAVETQPDPEKDPDQDALAEAANDAWWIRLKERQRQRPHSPGMWVVYFSMAALPLFGIGHVMIAKANGELRSYVLRLLALYIGCGLGLLLTTSFLNLRRYLRQRRLEMPLEMAAGWIGTGAVIIAIVLALAALVPRPGGGLSPGALVRLFSPDGGRPWRFGLGEGIDNETNDDRSETSNSHEPSRTDESQRNRQDSSQLRSESEESQRTESSSHDDNSDSRQRQRAERTQPSQRPDASPQRPDASRRSEAARSDDEQQPTDSPVRPDEQRSETSRASERSESGPSDNRRSASESDDEQADHPTSGEQEEPTSGEQEERGESDQRGNDETSSAASETTARRRNRFSLGGLTSAAQKLFQFIFYAGLFLVAAVLVWRYRAELAAWFKQMLEQLREFWARLFGGSDDRSAPDDAVGQTQRGATHPAFAEFTNPFRSGMARRWTPDQLVKYTFEALEAWAREHDCPREPEQTPLEFARQIGRRHTEMWQDTRRLATLYNQAAYADGTLSPEHAAHVEPLWQRMYVRDS